MNEQSELDYIEQELAAVVEAMKPLQERADNLHRRKVAIEQAQLLREYGFEKEARLSVTPELLALFGKRGWSNWEIADAKNSGIVVLKHLSSRGSEVVGTISALLEGWGTGDIPVEILQHMKADYDSIPVK